MKEILKKKPDTILAVLVSGHAISVFLEAYLHQQTDLIYLMYSNIVSILIFMLAPMASAALVSSKWKRYGLVLLCGMMPAFCSINVYNKFFPVQPPVPAFTPFGLRSVHEVFFWLMLFAELVLFAAAARLMRMLHAQDES